MSSTRMSGGAVSSVRVSAFDERALLASVPVIIGAGALRS